ncbi:MAG: tripartite tricarboxylate transporter permease [Candidatus Methylomirabilota bacterium]
MHVLVQACQLIFDPFVLIVMLLSGAFGLFMGAMPGLSATMATALLVPVTFFMDPVPALASMVTATAMAIFAGDLPGVLLRIPGTPASAAYTNEAYEMTKQGKAELALGTCLTASVIGGLAGSVVLATAAPVLAEIALKFSSYEFFWLACLGLTCAALISTGSPVKGVVSLLFGVFLSTVGLDPILGFPRFTFDYVELMGGINFIPAMVGMFAIAEVLRSVTSLGEKQEPVQASLKNIFAGVFPVLRRYWVNLIRGSAIGIVIGALPGAGGDIAAWINYAVSKKFSKTPEKFNTGHVEGLVDASASNNASLGGAWVPALVFGIPGDSITAIVIGVLYVKGMNPGPMVFIERPELIYAVFLSFFLANLLLIPLGYAAIKGAKRLLLIPREILMPIIMIFCVVGSFAINNTVFGVSLMLILGLIAYYMEENGFPVAPAILGLVLGGIIEENFMSSMMKSSGDLTVFFARPVGAALGVVTIAIWFSPLLFALKRRLFPSPQA